MDDTVKGTCPYCHHVFEFEKPVNWFDVDENEEIDRVVCPNCGKECAIVYKIDIDFYLIKAKEEKNV